MNLLAGFHGEGAQHRRNVTTFSWRQYTSDGQDLDRLACCISLALIMASLVSYLIHQSLFKLLIAVNDGFGGANSGN